DAEHDSEEYSDQQSLLSKHDGSVEEAPVDRDDTIDAAESDPSTRFSGRFSNLEPFPANVRKNDIINVYVATWNLGNARPPSVSDLRSWLPPDQYDVYGVGVQECSYAVDAQSTTFETSVQDLSGSLSPHTSNSSSISDTPFTPGCEDHWFR